MNIAILSNQVSQVLEQSVEYCSGRASWAKTPKSKLVRDDFGENGSSRTGYRKERTVIFLNIIFLTTPCLQFVSRIYEVFYQN